MKFKTWFLQESVTIDQLGEKYAQLLQDVKQDAKHHKEGNALIHTKMVVDALEPSRIELQNIQKNNEHPLSSIISDLNFDISEEEKNILTFSAYFHDIAKATRTEEKEGKITSYEHQNPKYFKPLIEELFSGFSPEIQQLYRKDEALIDWLIEHHMHLCIRDVFSKEFLRDYFRNGKIVNDPKIKLLLILMWADQSGRHSDHVPANIAKTTSKIVASAQKHKEEEQRALKQQQNKGFNQGPAEFVKLLKSRNASMEAIVGGLRKKFGLSDEQIKEYL